MHVYLRQSLFCASIQSVGLKGQGHGVVLIETVVLAQGMHKTDRVEQQLECKMVATLALR